MRYDAIYARQSVDKMDSISIESQIDICKKEAGKHYKVYADKGYSGKNMDRPEFANLMKDITDNKVSKVIVYRLDRISRSVLDFSSMISTFQKYDVEFVSTMEKFDTSSPIGNAMLMIVMVFAQLERETIQRRVIDAYKSRSEKGFYMGGRVPYGFTLKETVIDGIRTKMYVPVEDEIAVVKKIFEIYSQQHASFGAISYYLSKQGIKTKRGNYFTRATVRNIIINPSYVKSDMELYNFFIENKVRIISPKSDFVGIHGGYLYSDHDKQSVCTTSLEGMMFVLAPHEGIIDSKEWIKCRKRCLNNYPVASYSKAKHSWLAGKLKCAICGHSLRVFFSGSNKAVRRKRYYLCGYKYQNHSCTFTSIDADELDGLVLQAMKKKISTFREFSVNKQSENKSKIEKLRVRVNEINIEIENLLGKIAEASTTVMGYINKKVDSLDAEKAQIEEQIVKLIDAEESVDIVNLEEYMDNWDNFSNNDKMAVVDCLIESIHALPGEVTIKWKI